MLSRIDYRFTALQPALEPLNEAESTELQQAVESAETHYNAEEHGIGDIHDKVMKVAETV